MFTNIISHILGNDNNSTSHKAKQPKERSLQFEPLEAREMLSVNPLQLPEMFSGSDQVAVTQDALPQSFQVEEADATTTLTGLTLNVTAANYAELNAQYDFANVTSITDSTLTADGVTLNFSSCAELVNTSLTAKNGGKMKFPVLTSYSEGTGNSTAWNATGSGSQLDFSALTTIDSYNDIRYSLSVTAASGGEINLSKVTTIDYAGITSQGIGGLIDLPGLATIGATGMMSITTDGDSRVKFRTNIDKIENATMTGLACVMNFDTRKMYPFTVTLALLA